MARYGVIQWLLLCKYSNAMLKLIMLVFLTATAISACDGPSAQKENGNFSAKDQKFIQTLNVAIRSANRIIVTEHSTQSDFHESQVGKAAAPKEIVYGTKELGSWQTFLLKSIVTNASEKGSGLYSLCMFQPHHTIYFYEDKRLLNKLAICFECGDVLLVGETTSSRPPLISMLSTFIEHIGFQPKRDWQSLANDSKK